MYGNDDDGRRNVDRDVMFTNETGHENQNYNNDIETCICDVKKKVTALKFQLRCDIARPSINSVMRYMKTPH